MGRNVLASGAWLNDADGSTPAGFANMNLWSASMEVASTGSGTETIHCVNPAMGDIRPTSGSYSTEQFFKLKLTTLGGAANNDKLGGCLRMSADVYTADPDPRDTYRVYLYLTTPLTVVIERQNNTSIVSLATDTSITNWTANDTIEGEISGTGGTVTISMFRNGVFIFSYPDTDANRITAAGRPGFCGVQGGDQLRGKDWQLGDVVASTIAQRAVTMAAGGLF